MSKTDVPVDTRTTAEAPRRRRVRNALKLVTVNIAVFLCLLLVLNVTSAIAVGLYNRKTGLGSGSDWRAALPNYPDHARADLMFQEYWNNAKKIEYTPFVEWTYPTFHGKTLTIDPAGDRVNPHADAPSSPSRVVRFFGGSTMFGFGAEDNGTIPAVFQQMDPRTEVHNHGVTGYNTRQDLEHLINLLNVGAQADAVVFYEGINDIVSLCRSKYPAVNTHGADATIKAQLHRREGLLQHLSALFLNNTIDAVGKLAARLGIRKYGITSYSCGQDPERTRQAVDSVVRDITIANQLVSASGGRFVMFLQPASYIGSPRVDRVRKDMANQGAGIQEAFNAYYPLLRDRLTASGIEWHDLSGAFDGDQYIYVDAYHVSRNGNEIIANKIKDVLDQPRR